ncbi:bone morphogenetic protein 3 [Solea senegalensis]|uniref:Bone morphogenetic protein 3 n=1 Tax=Solea senegalensis TaxID=28829 RepID=A0AAV6PKI2_SOLSE|nr:bone morphogenetic protein 3 [Solea senegalensis]KAG7465405.1 bone morphogenetic protein 3 [Solea senegalensis]
MCPLVSRVVLALLCVWAYLCRGQCALLRTDTSSERRTVDKHHEDTLTEHMQLLYDKYTRAGFSFRDGNTVRSFKAHRGSVDRKQLQIFNLTSLTKSEDVLSATLHFYVTDLRKATRGGRGHRSPRGHTHVHVVIWSFGSVADEPRTLGQFHVNVSTPHRGGVSWQWKDITRALTEAKHRGELLIGIDVKKNLPLRRSPYILVYANDSSVSEPESVVATLQRHRAVGGDSLGSAPHSFLRLGERNQTRRRRSVDVLLPLQNNELPGPEYPYETAGWDESGPYRPLQNKRGRRPRKKTRKNQRHKVPLLQFDEHTINTARKKQWNEPRNCARRHLKVDFADIGWSEWIISPESFEAFYCSGSCQFPMPKSLKPSNHATIQSIVRAVGVVPGIPEPCCVPETMSSLSILFFDEDKNVVLKVYPNMTVDSCACR